MRIRHIRVWFSIAAIVVLCVSGLPSPVQAEDALQKTPPAGTDGTWVTIMAEGFGGWPNAGWDVFDANGSYGGEVFWDDDTYKPHSGSWSAWCARGGANGQVPPAYYPNDMDSWAVYGPFSLADATDAELSFYVWNKSEPNYDYFKWMASADCAHFDQWVMSRDSNGWEYRTLDLGYLAGDGSVCIAFGFTSDGNTTNVGAFIDDVVLQKYVPTCYSLTTSVSPAGSGTVSASPAPNCSGKYTSGTTVTLTANANAGYEFDHWSGGASGTINPVSVVMSGDKSVTANFGSSAPCYELTLSVDGGGGDPATADPPHSAGCETGYYNAGETITLTPHPDDGYVFWYYWYAEGDTLWSYPPTFSMPAGDASLVTDYWGIVQDIGVIGGVVDLALGGSGVMPMTLWNRLAPAVKVGAITVEWPFDPFWVQAAACDLDPDGLFDGGECSIDNDLGLIRLSAFSLEGVPGDALLARITLVGVGDTGGYFYGYPVQIVTLADPDGNDIAPFEEAPGYYRVGAQANGDVDCSGSLGITDAMFVLQYVVGLRSEAYSCPVDSADELFLPACDVNGDGACNVVDALFIAQCVDGGYANPLCPAKGLRPGESQPAPQWQAPQAGVGLNLGAVDNEAGGSVTVPIWLALGAQPLGAATVQLDLDPAVYTIEGCTADPAGALDVALCAIDAAAGQVRLTGIAAAGVSGDLVLAEVTIRMANDVAKEPAPVLKAPVLVDPAGRPIDVVIRYGISD